MHPTRKIICRELWIQHGHGLTQTWVKLHAYRNGAPVPASVDPEADTRIDYFTSNGRALFWGDHYLLGLKSDRKLTALVPVRELRSPQWSRAGVEMKPPF